MTPECRAAIGLSAASLPAALSVQDLTPPSTLPSGAVNWGAPHVAGEVLIVGDEKPLAQAAGQLGGLELTPLGDGLQRAKTPQGQTDRAFAEQLAAAGLRAQPNFIYRALAVPNDPGFPGNAGVQVGKFNVFQTYLSRIRVPQAWATLAACGQQPTGALTALVDTPLDRQHPELQVRITLGSVGLPLVAAAGYTGHGTAGAGIIAANTNNNTGLSGIVWNASLLSEEVLDASGGTTEQIAQGINDAVKKGAKVINLSLGEPDVTSDPVLDRAINAAEKSAVVVVAAGNTADQGVYYPANLPGVVAVGSTGTNDSALACYSARPNAELPRRLDIVAPSGGGYEGGCEGAAEEDDLLLLAPGGGYTLAAGTSFAAPQVSAVAALMRAANPKLTAVQTRALLLRSVNSASGLPLLDADAAVKAALRGD